MFIFFLSCITFEEILALSPTSEELEAYQNELERLENEQLEKILTREDTLVIGFFVFLTILVLFPLCLYFITWVITKKILHKQHPKLIGTIIAIFTMLPLLFLYYPSLVTFNSHFTYTSEDSDSAVNDAIVYCEGGGRLCYQIMPAWLEICESSSWKDVPSCHDGRIEQLIENPIEMTGECKELHEKLKDSTIRISYRHY